VLLSDADALDARSGLLEAILERGHRLHLAVLDPAMADPRRRLSRFCAKHPQVSLGHAVARDDDWRWTAAALREALVKGAKAKDDETRRDALASMGLPAPADSLGLRRALDRLRRLHEAIPPSRQVVGELVPLDLDVLVLTDLEHRSGGQAEYLLACRQLGLPALYVGSDAKTESHVAGAWRPDALLIQPLDMPPISAIEAAAAVSWPSRPSPAWLRPSLEALRARLTGRGEAGGGPGRFYVERVLPRILSAGAGWLPAGRPLLREHLSEQLAKGEIRRLADLDVKFAQAIAAPGALVFGPWLGSAEDELLFWIPFLSWLRKAHQVDKSRMIALGQGGKRLWYAASGAVYFDLEEVWEPDQLAHELEQLSGPSKRPARHAAFRTDCARRAAAKAGFESCGVVDAELMWRLYQPYMAGHAGMAFMERHARVQAVAIKPGKVERATAGLSQGYAAVQFRAGPSFPDTEENRALAAAVVRRLAQEREVLLFPCERWAKGAAVDLTEGVHGPGIRRFDERHAADFSAQTLLVAGSRGFVGAPGGLAVVAAQLGLRALCLEAAPDPEHALRLEWAKRAFGPLGGRLVSLPVGEDQELALALLGLAPPPEAGERSRLASVG
jgi:hypothetical protein